jgi:hypothetical protein
LGALSEDGDSVRVRGMPDDQLPLESPSEDFAERAISPLVELGAYEAMWEEPNASFKRLAEKFAQVPGSVPSDFVPTARATEYGQAVSRQLRESGERFGVRVSGAAEYPKRLRDAAYPCSFFITAAGGTWLSRGRSRWWGRGSLRREGFFVHGVL